jgi:pilus assembly protein Flp/PilA
MLAKVTRHVTTFLKNEDGPTAVEYAVMLALIIVVCIAAITGLGSTASNTFANVQLKTALAAGSTAS